MMELPPQKHGMAMSDPAPMQNPARGVAPEVGFQGQGDPAQGEGGQEQAASPEEQAVYDKVMKQAYTIIYDGDIYQNLVTRLGQSGDPVEGMSSVVFMVISTIEKSAVKAGQYLPEGVLFNAAVEIIEDIADSVKEVGAYDYTEKQMERALFKTVDMYGSSKTEDGTINKEEAQADLNEIITADKNGTLLRDIPALGNAVDEAQMAGGQK